MGSRQVGLGFRIFIIAMAAAIYLGLGALGLWFAIPPGYASPIFPASGFAVAVVLWSKGRAWPGIWLGSCALNLGVAWLRQDLGGRAVLGALGIACGSTLQSVAAGWLLARGVRNGWQTLVVERDIIRCMVLGGPVACLVSASVGMAVLFGAGVLSWAELPYGWWSWWSGDTLGVLVLLPLSLAVFYYHRPLWRGRLATLVLPMLIALGLVGSAFFTVSEWEVRQQKQVVQGYGEKLAQLLSQRFIAHQEALSALRRLQEIMPDMGYEQFDYFTRITLEDNPDIFAFSIDPAVPLARRAAFERTMALKTGAAGFEIKERDGQGRLVRAADRPDYVAVAYIAPLEKNLPALGYDIDSEPIRHEAIERARALGTPVVTAPIHLVQENQERIGILLLHPVRPLRPPSVSDPGWAGFVVGVVKMDEMVRIALGEALPEGLALRIEDAQAPAGRSLLYRSGEALADAQAWRKSVAMADRTWNFSLVPTPAFLNGQSHWMALAVGSGGLALAVLLQILLLVTTGRTAVVEGIVWERTMELHAKSEALQDRHAELDALFRLSPDGFVAFGPDDRIKFANPAFRKMLGLGDEGPADMAGLDRLLWARCEGAGPCGIADFFEGEAGHKILTLKAPRPAVLYLLGVASGSLSVPRILYLRDITRETEVDRMKSEFLSHAAHELRTPMTSIFGFTEVLLNMEVDEATRRELLQIIHRQTQWLIDIVNELLDLSKIDAGRGKDVQIEVFDLAALVRATVADSAADAQQRPWLLDLPDGEKPARADVFMLRQALVNVLSNARKFSEPDAAIHIALLEEGDRLGVAVTDHGVGMTPEELEHLGERFWRADPSGQIPGTGLGIAIVMEAMKMQGGRMEVRSEKNRGTTVTLWVPGQGRGAVSGGVAV